jgi:peptidyl-prolyl cis-trans isomerase SurA
MKRYGIVAVVALIYFFSPLSVRAQQYEKGLIDKTVALIGKDAIMLSDIEVEVQMMRANGYVADKSTRCDILEQLLENKLFLTQARLDSIMVTPVEVQENVDQRINSVVTQLGGEKEAEEYFKKPIYKLKLDWYDKIEEVLLIQRKQQDVYSSVADMTPADVRNYAESTPQEELPVIPTKYKMRHIVLYPDKDAASEIVKERMLELRDRIIKGEKFSSLARLYSEDPGSAVRGGELGMASKTIFWPAFSDAATALKVGQVSQLVETPDGFHIIQMIAKDGDMFNARHILIKPKYTAKDRSTAFNKLDSIKALILDSTLTFQQAAWMNSMDMATRTNGGQMVDPVSASPYYEKDQLKPADFNILKNMNPGDISDPFESLDDEGRGNTIYKILLLEELVPSHIATFDGDYDAISHDAITKKAKQALDDFVTERQKTTYIKIDPLFQGCTFKRDGWIKEE